MKMFGKWKVIASGSVVGELNIMNNGHLWACKYSSRMDECFKTSEWQRAALSVASFRKGEKKLVPQDIQLVRSDHKLIWNARERRFVEA